MTSPLPPYPKYKSSGVPWLGDIPAHWQCLPHRALFAEINDRNHPDEPLLSVTISKGIIRQSDFLADSSKKDSSNENKGNYKLVQPEDIAYNKMRAWQGAIGVSSYRGIVSAAYVVVRPRDRQNPRYFHYLFRTPAFATEAERFSYGITSDQWSLRGEDFKRIYSALPPRSEQDAIVQFLDATEILINRLIRAKRRLIELPNEEKSVLIHRAVTQGLDPTAPKKPSGVEWLGDIPAHWTTTRLGTLAESLQTGPFGSQLHAQEYMSGGIPVINPSHMTNGKIKPDINCAISSQKANMLSRHLLQIGDFVFARRGELGRCALVCKEEMGFLCGTGSLRVRIRASFADEQYLLRLFLSKGIAEWLGLQSVGSTMDNLNTGILSRLPLPIPPIEEQSHIISYVTEAEKRIQSAIQRTQCEIALLREYRTRLVADVVTGKVDVRRVVVPVEEVSDVLDAETGDDVEEIV